MDSAAYSKRPKYSRQGICSKPANPSCSFKEKYKVLKTLGKGSEGTVYLGRIRATREPVAIKQTNTNLETFYAAKQVLREISILRHLSKERAGKFISKILDVIWEPATAHEESRLFIILEMIEGRTLKEFMDDAQNKVIKLTSARARKVIYGMVRALEAVHDAGVIHRDIKPANLIVTPDDQVKLIDFGLARTMPSRGLADQQYEIPKSKSQKKELGALLSETRRQRKAGKRSLSPHVYSRIYRPPEVCLLEKEYSFSADVWSLGCIIGELLQCQHEYTLSTELTYIRFLFKSTSCYPLSPNASLEGNEPLSARLEEEDLLKVILKVLGDQKKYDLSFLTSNSQMAFMKQNMAGRSRVKLGQEFSKTPSDLVQLLEMSLEFNPFFRSTARQLLESTAFKSEPGASAKKKESSKLWLDVDSQGMFDYSTCTSLHYTVDDLKEMIAEEARKISKIN